jgi:hypothetical protein
MSSSSSRTAFCHTVQIQINTTQVGNGDVVNIQKSSIECDPMIQSAVKKQVDERRVPLTRSVTLLCCSNSLLANCRMSFLVAGSGMPRVVRNDVLR